MNSVSFEAIERAGERARKVIQPSPLIHSSDLSRQLGAEVYLKLENLQATGSFKVRGAYNRLVNLAPEERERGIIAASAGNHALGVAWAGAILGIDVTIVMPQEVSIRKLVAVKEYGTEVVLHGTYYHDAQSRAEELARQTGKILIPAYDDPLVIAGQGTIGLEIAPYLKESSAVVVPIGGGGLISGVALAIKQRHPQVQVIGVQSAGCPSTIRSLKEDTPVSVDIAPTLADGIAVKQPGDHTFPLIQAYVDQVVSVDDEGIAVAILSLLEKGHVVAEGAGACPLAALMEHGDRIKAETYILIISGGNIETHTMDRILHRGSIKMGRLIRMEVNLPDVPGSLAQLLGIIADERANILHIFHDRLALENPIQVSRVELNLETRGPDHAAALFDSLREAGYACRKIL